MTAGKRSGEEAGCNLPTMLVEEEFEMLWLVEVREGAGDWWTVAGYPLQHTCSDV